LLTPKLSHIKQVFWYDLTAGDGVAYSSRSFENGCSPGIMLHHAGLFGAHNKKPLVVNGFEIQSETLSRLQRNLRNELSQTNIEGKVWVNNELQWNLGSAKAQYQCTDAKTIVPQLDAQRSTSAVFIYNDPNSITQWCLTEEFISLCPKFTTSLSTLGCNANGLKRAPRETREQWFERTRLIASSLQHWHDLCLFSVGNADQWAYLISAPVEWREQITADCRKAHAKSGITKNPEVEWLKADKSAFRRLEKKLFLTKAELTEEESNDQAA